MSDCVHFAKTRNDFDLIRAQMKELFGEQSHLTDEIFYSISELFPGFVNIIRTEIQSQCGHIVFLPLNKVGYEKMISPSFAEKDILKSDLFDPSIDKKIFIFVYSIYGTNPYLTKYLIKETVKSIETQQNVDIEKSVIFAEVVSKRGDILARRLGLEKYFSYQYEDELLHLYKTSVKAYLDSYYR